MSALDEHLKKHRKKIIDREEKTFREMLSAYYEIEKELKKQFDALQQQIEDAQANDEQISLSWFYRENRLKNLLAQVREQITRFGGNATKIIESEQRAAIEIAVSQADDTFKVLVTQNTEGDANLPDARNFASTLNPRTVETAVGVMGDGSPIIKYFEQQLAPMVAEKIKTEVIKAVAIGTDFRTIGKSLEAAGDITKHRALSVARTEVNRVRREATREIYEENSDIIEKWEWVASKSTRTCPLCLAMDGRTFPLTEPFPQHINCRCTMIPVIEGLPRRSRTIGKDWFEKQDDETKAKILGKETFLAYQEHDLNLDDFVTFRNDKRFGKSVSRKPLAKILADKGIDDNFETISLPNNIQVDFGRGTKTRLKNFFGKNLSENEIGGMVGALDNAKVKVIINEEDSTKLSFYVEHSFIEFQQRTLGIDDDDQLFFHNDYFRTSDIAPKGTGVKSFATQALTSKKYGVQYIHTYAAGSSESESFNVYYSWARMGYNAPLFKSDKMKLSDKYQSADDLNELMNAGGKDEWKKHGTGRDMYFMLDDDSTSWDVLLKYLQERKLKVKF